MGQHFNFSPGVYVWIGICTGGGVEVLLLHMILQKLTQFMETYGRDKEMMHYEIRVKKYNTYIELKFYKFKLLGGFVI